MWFISLSPLTLKLIAKLEIFRINESNAMFSTYMICHDIHFSCTTGTRQCYMKSGTCSLESVSKVKSPETNHMEISITLLHHIIVETTHVTSNFLIDAVYFVSICDLK